MYCQWLLLQLNSDILRENPTCVTFTILDICRSVQQVFFCFSYQCKSTPLQVWKDKKSRVASSSSPPQIAPPPPHCGPTSWPSLLRCDVCRSVDGGSSSGRCLSWKMGRCSFFFFFSEHVLPFSFSCWIVWPLLKAKSWTREKGPVVEALAASQTMSKVVGRRVNVLQKSAQKLVPFLHWLTV